MARHNVLATTLKQWLHPSTEVLALRGTWRDTGSNTERSAPGASPKDHRLSLYRSEAFAEDLCEKPAMSS